MTTVGVRHFGRHVDENGSFIVTEFYYKRSLYAEVIFTELSNAIRDGHRRNPRAPTYENSERTEYSGEIFGSQACWIHALVRQI